jgi:two-component system response regulator PilR (NtrC family)
MNKPTVLVVDDEPDILQLLEITLSRMQLNTLKASSLAEAKASLEKQPPDLCLTDMKLPDGNGLTLIEHMQNHFPDVPVAISSPNLLP